jgi:hypothetical protein
MEKIKEISQNADRYSVTPSGWKVSASPSVTPLELIKEGLDVPLYPLLSADGIIVDVDGILLCSPATYEWISNPTNPHYDTRINGRVTTTSGLTTTIGGTIPTIRLTTDSLRKLAAERDTLNRNAGVESVDYIFEGSPTPSGLPSALIEQINYALTEERERPEDGFSLWNLSLSANYSIEKLKVITAQSETVFSQAKLDEFIKGIGERLAVLREDFNMIKEVFYNANTPTNKGKVGFRLRATPDTDTNQNHTVEFKYTKVVDTKTTQTQATAIAVTDQKAALEKAKTELSSQITTQSEELKRAQSGDSAAQSRLTQELAAARADSATLRNVLKDKKII